MRRLPLWIASVCGAGYFPWASGTFATLLAVPCYFWLRPYPLAYGAAVAGLCVLGVWSAGEAEKILREKDSHKIVIDEVAGYLLAAACLPSAWIYPAGAFFLFRLFDVWKPFPARQSQALPGGWGVMADDVIAAIYANLLLQLGRLLMM